MSGTDGSSVATPAGKSSGGANGAVVKSEQIVEIVSDSGEGAQKAGQTFGTISAKMGNGVWTVEIIPAEIKPPARSKAGASGIRVRIASDNVTNMGDEADLVVAFNEQVLYGRIEQHAYKKGTVVLLENKWAASPMAEVQKQYTEAVKEFKRLGLDVREMPLEEKCLEFMPDPRLGKNMFVLGMLCSIYGRDLQKAADEIAVVFKKKGEKVIELNRSLLQAGFDYGRTQLSDLSVEIPPRKEIPPQVVMNGNQALALGIMASGMDVVAMYPITPATSVSHHLAGTFHRAGGILHQAEDEIAAIGFAVGASYAGKTACTITSGPGLALKTEFLSLAVMAEIPLVTIIVQRGGPSTGLPTKVEQGELLTAVFGATGDNPKIVMAAATIEECFHFVIVARKLAEEFRMPVLLLSDANLATGVQPFPRPEPQAEWLASPFDQSPWQEGVRAYDWDHKTGMSTRPIPGQVGGEYVLTGLAHTEESKVAYEPEANQFGCTMRSRKLASFQSTLRTPVINGEPEGDLLVIGWGSTLGAIDEAVANLQADGRKVSSLHLRFLSPLEPGLSEIFARFNHVMTVEINYSDPADDPLVTVENRRRAQLARLIRSRTLCDVDCWSNVHGQPLHPRDIYDEIIGRLDSTNGGEVK